jgi:hypothetical protein
VEHKVSELPVPGWARKVAEGLGEGPHVVVTGISVNKLQTPQEVEKMVDELRYELQSNTVGKLRLDDLPLRPL